mgnify:CR=1 FL=1
MGLFTLVACGEDVYQDANKINESGTVENSSGGMQTNSIDPAIPYESPYDINICCSPVNYEFINNTDLDLEFSPYVGLARYDGADDLKHYWSLNRIDYPNLIANESGEYFKLAECHPFSLPAFTTFNPIYQSQCPTFNGFFSLVNSTPTSIEEAFLNEYGKVYSINATIRDPNNFNMVVRGNEHLKFAFLPVGVVDPVAMGSGDWLQVPSTNPPFTDDLWYNVQTREICIGNDSAAFPGGGDGINNKPSEIIFDYIETTYILKLYTTSTSVVISLDYL